MVNETQSSNINQKPEMDPTFTLPARWPLVPVEVAAFYLDRLPEEVLRDCDCLWAWDISAGGGERRQLRLWRDSLIAVRDPAGRPDIPGRVDQVIARFLPWGGLRGRDLQQLFFCTAQHISALAAAGILEIQRERQALRGPNATRIYSRDSVKKFLADRVTSQSPLPFHPDSRN